MSEPLITTISHSGGVQSQLIVEMVLRGDIERPKHLVVINADPGMEDSRTYRFVRDTRRRCLDAGIDYINAQGPDLFRDIINTVANGATRIDNPPFWCFKAPQPFDSLEGMYTQIAELRRALPASEFNKHRGRLAQGCTTYYKIDPMRRALRGYLEKKHGIKPGQLASRPGTVETWIGFAQDEWHRCSDSDVAYITLRYPLIEKLMSKKDCVGYFLGNKIPMPPRSVCNACFANGLDHYRDMYMDRPDDWAQAVEVDNSIERWHEQGITKYPVFVSGSLMRLRDMPAANFGSNDEDLTEHHCNSGVCFL